MHSEKLEVVYTEKEQGDREDRGLCIPWGAAPVPDETTGRKSELALEPTAYGKRAECHSSNLRHEPLVLMVAGHIVGPALAAFTCVLVLQSPFHSISLYSPVIHIRAHRTDPGCSPPDIASVDVDSRQMVCRRVDAGKEVGKEKSGIAVFTSGRAAARDSSKIEAIPAVATLRMAERADTFRWTL